MSTAFNVANLSTGAGPFFKFSEDQDWIQIKVHSVTDRQATNWKTGQPEYYPDGNPVMNQIVAGELLQGVSGGEEFESDDEEGRVRFEVGKRLMRRAIIQAIADAGASDIEPGGILTLQRDGYGPKGQGANPPQNYEAQWELPEAEGAEWGEGSDEEE